MSRPVYSIRPQRLVAGSGYVNCEPHQAARFVVVECKKITARQTITRIVGEFTGKGALAAAQQALNQFRGLAAPRSAQPKSLWGRSLTAAEYLLARSKTHA